MTLASETKILAYEIKTENLNKKSYLFLIAFISRKMTKYEETLLFCCPIWSSLNKVNLSFIIIMHIKGIIMEMHFTLIRILEFPYPPPPPFYMNLFGNIYLYHP